MDKDSSVQGNEILAQRIAAALLTGGKGVNTHEMVNSYNVKKARKQVVKAYYDKKGMTMPASALVLRQDAERNIKHSRALTSNMKKADPTYIKLEWVDAHHIVGQGHSDARTARLFLFMWGIGINDADNGVYLPRYARISIINMPNAHSHQGLHTTEYYLNVTLRLQATYPGSQAEKRFTLREIKNELIAGTFPF